MNKYLLYIRIVMFSLSFGLGLVFNIYFNLIGSYLLFPHNNQMKYTFHSA